MDMRRIGIALGASAALLVISAGAGQAHAGHPAPDGFGGQSPTIVNDYGDHYVNANNPDVRFDWTCHQMATPGEGDAHADQDHSAVIDRTGDSGLVAPGDKDVACT